MFRTKSTHLPCPSPLLSFLYSYFSLSAQYSFFFLPSLFTLTHILTDWHTETNILMHTKTFVNPYLILSETNSHTAPHLTALYFNYDNCFAVLFCLSLMNFFYFFLLYLLYFRDTIRTVHIFIGHCYILSLL